MPIDFIVGLPHLNVGPSPEARLALQEILLDIQRDARLRAEKSWRSRKPPVAAYWAACGVYAGHIARSIGPGPGRRPLATAALRPNEEIKTC